MRIGFKGLAEISMSTLLQGRALDQTFFIPLAYSIAENIPFLLFSLIVLSNIMSLQEYKCRHFLLSLLVFDYTDDVLVNKVCLFVREGL